MIITSRLPLPLVPDWGHLLTLCQQRFARTSHMSTRLELLMCDSTKSGFVLAAREWEGVFFALSGGRRAGQGVKLSHGNLFYQLSNFNHFITPQPGDSTLSLLPPWHIYGGRRCPASTVSTLCFFILHVGLCSNSTKRTTLCSCSPPLWGVLRAPCWQIYIRQAACRTSSYSIRRSDRQLCSCREGDGLLHLFSGLSAGSPTPFPLPCHPSHLVKGAHEAPMYSGCAESSPDRPVKQHDRWQLHLALQIMASRQRLLRVVPTG